MALCLDGPPNCLAGANELTPPDGEAFWWAAEAEMRDGAKRLRLVLAAEAAFDENGKPISFGRIRVVGRGLQPGATYTITHPYGAMNLTADGKGRIKNRDGDVGCAPAPNAKCDFTEALDSRGFQNFLEWPTRPGNGYIGNPAVDHVVTGSPTGNNFFQVTGPGVNVTETQFSVQGKLAP